MNSEKIKVFCMKRMLNFLSNNGPWDQLIKNNNISLSKIKENRKISLTMRKDIRKYCLDNFDWSSIIKQYKEIIDKL